MQHHFNTEIAKKYGMEEAILLENIYFWVKKNKANNKNFYNGDYWTYNTVKAFNEIFDYMTPSKISRALKHLEEENLIKTGCFNSNKYDRTKWYAVTEKAKSIFENENSILQNEKWKNENEKSNFQNSEMNITDINTNNNTNNNTYIDRATDTDKPEKKKTTSFQKPTVEEVRAYCEERGNTIDPEKFIDYYNSNGWKVGKSSMKDWKATIRNWERNEKERNTPKAMKDPDKLYF